MKFNTFVYFTASCGATGPRTVGDESLDPLDIEGIISHIGISPPLSSIAATGFSDESESSSDLDFPSLQPPSRNGISLLEFEVTEETDKVVIEVLTVDPDMVDNGPSSPVFALDILGPSDVEDIAARIDPDRIIDVYPESVLGKLSSRDREIVERQLLADN